MPLQGRQLQKLSTLRHHTKDHMGLTTWKNAPDGRILKSDVSIAKNYLQENEIRRLERAVTGYFDYIEDLIERENTFNMEQFAASVNEFLTFRKYQILPDKGRISAAQAKAKAESEYDILIEHNVLILILINRLKECWISNRIGVMELKRYKLGEILELQRDMIYHLPNRKREMCL